MSLWGDSRLRGVFVVMVTVFLASCSCADDEAEVESRGSVAESLDPVNFGLGGSKDDYLPMAVMFKRDGSPVIVGIDKKGQPVPARKLDKSDFPVEAKILKMETLSLVLYEGSCEVMVFDGVRYSSVTIYNQAACDYIKSLR